jgi:hypothetical protein
MNSNITEDTYLESGTDFTNETKFTKIGVLIVTIFFDRYHKPYHQK